MRVLKTYFHCMEVNINDVGQHRAALQKTPLHAAHLLITIQVFGRDDIDKMMKDKGKFDL